MSRSTRCDVSSAHRTASQAVGPGRNVRYVRWRWATFAITWLIYASFYLTRKAFSVAKVALDDPAASPAVAMTRADYGIVDSAYLTTYAIGQFVWGPLGDRFGPRWILMLGMLISIAAAVATGVSTTMAAFVAFAILQGLGQSAGWSNVVKTMSAWFGLRERGRVIGIWCTHYAVGAAVALPFAGWLMDYFGTPRPPGLEGSEIIPYWPAAFWGTAGALGGVLALSWWLLRNRPEDVGLPPIETYHQQTPTPEGTVTEDSGEKESWLATIGAVLGSPKIWLLAVSYFSIKLTRYALYFWGPKYVAESLGGGALASALTAVYLPIGGVVGVMLSGYVSDRVFQARRMPVTIIGLLLTAGTMLLGINPIHQPWLMSVFFFLIGFFLFGPDSIISGTAAMDFGTKKRSGTAAGLVNGVGSIGAILGGYLPGVVTTEDDWSAVFYIFIGGLLLSAALLSPLWNTLPPAGE